MKNIIIAATLILTAISPLRAADAGEPLVDSLGGTTICAKDPKTLADWYADILGIKLHTEGGQIYWTSIGPLAFGIHPAKDDASKECENLAAEGFVLSFHVDDYERFLVKIKAKGIVPEFFMPGGNLGTFAYFRDKENNRVAIYGK